MLLQFILSGTWIPALNLMLSILWWCLRIRIAKIIRIHPLGTMTISKKCYGNSSNHISLKTRGGWPHGGTRQTQWTIKIIRIHPVGTMNATIKFHGDPFSCWASSSYFFCLTYGAEKKRKKEKKRSRWLKMTEINSKLSTTTAGKVPWSNCVSW